MYKMNKFLINHNYHNIHTNKEIIKSVIGDVCVIDDLYPMDILIKEEIECDALKYINKDSNARFIPTKSLKDSYIKHEHVTYPKLNLFVNVKHNILGELELGIVDTKHNTNIAKGVSSLLTRSINDAIAEKNQNVYKNKHKGIGYIPKQFVERAQLEYVSPYGVSNLWGKHGYRFVLSRRINEDNSEIIGTALITSDEENLFFFTSKYNNVKVRTALSDKYAGSISHNTKNTDGIIYIEDIYADKWFEKFDMPRVDQYKPKGYHQLANFAIEKINYRGLRLGKFLIDEIIKNYTSNNPHMSLKHSQPLLNGKGLFHIADPSWKNFMLDIGFQQRFGAETFFIDKKWDPLVPIIINGKHLTCKEYNNMFGMPQMYDNLDPEYIENKHEHILDRIPHVVNLSKSALVNAKLQYYQFMLKFKNN